MWSAVAGYGPAGDAGLLAFCREPQREGEEALPALHSGLLRQRRCPQVSCTPPCGGLVLIRVSRLLLSDTLWNRLS